MSQQDDGQRASAPASIHVVHGFLPFVTIGAFATVGLSLLTSLRPALWSRLWWTFLLIGLVGAVLALIDWRRIQAGLRFPFSLVTDALALYLIWAPPSRLAAAMLFVLTSALIGALFPTEAVILHLAVCGVGLAGLALFGGDLGTALLVAVVLLGATAVMRVVYHMTREQLVQTDHLKRLMELLPVMKAHGVDEVIRAAVRHLVKATNSDLGVVFVYDEQTKVLCTSYLYSETGVSPEEERALKAITIPLGVGLSGWVAEHQQSLMTGDAVRDPRSMQVPGTPETDESIMVVPLMTNGRLYGVLRLDRPGLHKYRVEDMRLLELMAAHVSDALSRAQMEERMARRDALTGVYNRHFLNEWSERLTPAKAEISLLMIDCRGFKQINDRWGHLEGDRVLQACARIISASVRNRDLVVRYGGDEFLVVLENTGTAEARCIAERLQGKVEEWNERQPPDSPHLSLDIGVETAPQSEWGLLLERADVRMYASKRGA